MLREVPGDPKSKETGDLIVVKAPDKGLEGTALRTSLGAPPLNPKP